MLRSFPTKPCRYCHGRGHFSYKCKQNPKTKKYLRSSGKYAKEWRITKATWFDRNPPDQDPYPHYICYLHGHGEWLRPPEELAGFDNPLILRTTLDHVLSRARHPDNRAAQWNLQPCCPDGNQSKGSKDGIL